MSRLVAPKRTTGSKKKTKKFGVVDDGFRISDGFWEKIEPLLPPPKPHPLGCHNPPVEARQALNGIFFVLRTGCQWGALDETGICKKSSAHRWFQAWTEAGVFQLIWALALDDYDQAKGLGWEWQSMDGAMTKAPLGGEKNRSQSNRPSQTRRQAQPPDRRERDSRGTGGWPRQSQ